MTPRLLEWLLENRRAMRAGLVSREAPTGTVILLGRAIEASTITLTLDALDRLVDALPKGLQRLVHLRYTEALGVGAISRRIHWSERTCYRRLREARGKLSLGLGLQENHRLRAFWSELARALEEGSGEP